MGARGLLAEEGTFPNSASLRQIFDDDEKLFRNVDHSKIEVAPEKKFDNPDAGLTEEQRMQKIL
jgi:hypothetical protein